MRPRRDPMRISERSASQTLKAWDRIGARVVATGRPAWGVTMEDGTPVLGNLEFKGRALILAVASAKHLFDGAPPSSNRCLAGPSARR